MHIGAVGILEGEVPFEAYLENVEAKLSLLPRFRERIVATPFFVGHPTWESDPDFDIRSHMELHELPAPGGELELKALVDELMTAMLDRGRPLWELHVVHGLEGDNSAIVSKVHHAMVDGVGGNQIMTVLFDLSPNAEPPSPSEGENRTEPADPRTRVIEALWDNARGSLDAFADYQRFLLDSMLSVGPERLQSTVEMLRTAFPDMARPPERLPFNRACTGTKRFTWTTFSFAEARAVRSALGGTVNDVVLGLLAGAVSRYCGHHDCEVRGRSMRVMVPVNVRPDSEIGNLGNQVSVMPVDVPLGVDDPGQRIGLIQDVTRALKRGRVAAGISSMSKLLGAVPVPFQAAFGSMAVSPYPIFNIVCTNIPGPQIPLYALGQPLLAYYPYVPVGFDMGVGCAVFSYNQVLHIGLSSDANACPDVELLRECYDEAIAEMKKAAGVADIAPVDMFRRPGGTKTSPQKVSATKTVARKRKKSPKRRTTQGRTAATAS